MENNTDLPELMVAEGLAFFTSGSCLSLFKVKGRMVTLCFMSAQTALDMVLDTHQNVKVIVTVPSKNLVSETKWIYVYH